MTKTLAFALSLSTFAACTDDAAAPMAPAPEMPTQDMPQQPEMNPGVASGTLDPAFGTGGMRDLGLPGYASSITHQGDKLVACANQVNGKLEAVFARYLLDGSLDTSFGASGLAHYSGNVDLVCERIAARPDGSLVASMRLGTMRYGLRLDPTGHYAGITSGSNDVAGVTVSGDDVYHAVTMYAPDYWFLRVYNSETGSADINLYIPNDATASRVFVHDGVYTVTGVFHTLYGTGWAAMSGTAGSADPSPHAVTAGSTDVVDLLHDSIMLSNGYTFLVGGVDTNLAVMTSVFAKGTGTVETHGLGTASTGNGVVLDGMDRPIVVGSATIDGVSQYMWQRYDATGLALDASYAGGGVMAAPALSGSGELVSAVRIDGAIYALASNDVQSGTPSVGLVKIVE